MITVQKQPLTVEAVDVWEVNKFAIGRKIIKDNYRRNIFIFIVGCLYSIYPLNVQMTSLPEYQKEFHQ